MIQIHITFENKKAEKKLLADKKFMSTVEKIITLAANNSNRVQPEVIPKIAEYLDKLIKEYLQILKTDRYKEDAIFNVDEYCADMQKVTEDLMRLKKRIENNFTA